MEKSNFEEYYCYASEVNNSFFIALQKLAKIVEKVLLIFGSNGCVV